MLIMMPMLMLLRCRYWVTVTDFDYKVDLTAYIFPYGYMQSIDRSGKNIMQILQVGSGANRACEEGLVTPVSLAAAGRSLAAAGTPLRTILPRCGFHSGPPCLLHLFQDPVLAPLPALRLVLAPTPLPLPSGSSFIAAIFFLTPSPQPSHNYMCTFSNRPHTPFRILRPSPSSLFRPLYSLLVPCIPLHVGNMHVYASPTPLLVSLPKHAWLKSRTTLTTMAPSRASR